MLAGVKVVDRSSAEAALRDQHRAEKKEKKEKKALKKEKKVTAKKLARQKEDTAPDDNDASSDPAPQSSKSGDHIATDHPPAAAVGPAGIESETCNTREDWMTTPMARPPGAVSAAAGAGYGGGPTDKALKAQEAAAIAAARELNPGMRGDGDTSAPNAPIEVVVARPAGVGDGGSSWRLKALRRAQVQAAQQGVALDEVVSERWGNVANLKAGMAEQRAAHAKAHMAAAWERRGGPPTRGGSNRSDTGTDRGRGNGHEARDVGSGSRDQRSSAPGYLSDLKSDRPQMRRPSQGSGFSTRKAPMTHSRSGGTVSDRLGDIHADVRHSPGGTSARDSGGYPGSSDRDIKREEDVRQGYMQRNDRSRTGSDLTRGDSQTHPGDTAQSSSPLDGDGSRRESSRQHFEKTANRGESRGRSSPPRGTENETAGANTPGVAEHSRAASRAHASEGSVSVAAAHEANRASAPGQADEKPLATGNMSVAAALRARLMGKAAPAPTVPPVTKAGASAADSSGKSRPLVEVLPQIDARGRAVAGSFGREAAEAGARPSGFKAPKVQRYDADGKRERWTADDDTPDLATLVKRQRHEGAEDMDAAFADNIARKSGFKESDLNADDEYDFDTGIDLYQKRKGDQAQQAKRHRSAVVADSRRLSAALERCQLCISSHRRPKHLTLAIGEASYLMLPQKGHLVEGHCCIVPADHVASVRRCDGNVAIELRNFKKSLLQMFMAQDLDVVFMETAVRLDDSRSHAVIEAIPLPAKAFSKAPIYFKKAVDDAESEWSQHHAKRLIDTRAKGLHGSIPPNFPYFHVEFGLSSGFVHVIDDEAGWEPAFGRSILAGLLDLPANVGLAHHRAEPEAIQQRRSTTFLQHYREHDWTAQL